MINMKRNKKSFRRLLASLLALSLLCTSCGNPARATTMSLARTQGSVEVLDDTGNGVELIENLKLYSGYDVETIQESYAWINLDNVKLAKLDISSEALVLQDGGALEIQLKSGRLFFHVSEPLGDDESMTIRTSNMAVGIRGTCGWIELTRENHLLVYILEGTVECTVTGESGEVTAVYVSAGEMTELSSDGIISQADDKTAGMDNGTEKETGTDSSEETGSRIITATPFPILDVPDFVLEELAQDEELAEKILNTSGLDVLHPPVLVTQEALSALPYYGDLSKCRLTVEQAAAYAQILEDNILEAETAVWDEWYTYNNPKPKFCRAALFDAGDGIPALWIVGGYDMEYPINPWMAESYGEQANYWPSMSRIYHWDGTQAILATDLLPYDGYSTVTDKGLVFLHLTDFNFNTVSPAAECYPLSGGLISETPSHMLESILIEQPDPPTASQTQSFLALHGDPAQTYDYSTLTSEMWTDFGLGQPEWHVYALDGVFMTFETAADAWEPLTGFPYWGGSTGQLVYGEFGFGGYGVQDSYCHWQGDWRDCYEVAELLHAVTQ